MPANDDSIMPDHLPSHVSGPGGSGLGPFAGPAAAGEEAMWATETAARQSGSASAVTLAGVLRQKWLMLGVFLVLSAAAVPCLWVFIKPTYESRAVVRVAPVIPRLVYSTEQNGAVPFYESHLNTQVSLIRSQTVLKRVLDQPAVQKSFWYTQEGKSPLGGSSSPEERLAEALTVMPRPRTHLIDVSFGAEHPEDAERIVNAVVNEYLAFDKEAGNIEEKGVLETLRAEQKTRLQNIEYLRSSSTTANHPGVLGSDQFQATLSGQLNQMETRLADLKREKELMRWRRERLTPAHTTTAPAGGTPTTPAQEGRRKYPGDPEWVRLNTECERARMDLSLAKLTLAEGSYKVKQLNLTLNVLEERLKQRELELKDLPEVATSQPAPNQSGSYAEITDPRLLDERIAARSKEVELLEGDIKKLREEAETAQELGKTEEKLKHEEEVYNDVRKRLEALEMESKANSVARIECASPGIAPTKPTKDRRLLLTLLVLCGAAGCAVGAGYLRAMGDVHIVAPEQVRMVAHVPFLGQLSELRASEVPGVLGGENAKSNELALAGAATWNLPVPLMEGMRVIRTSLLDRLEPGKSHALLITSPMPRSGKSSFVVLLAGSLALLGKKVLVVEADLYRPALSRRLGVRAKTGLTQLLHGETTDKDTIVRNRSLTFDVLPAGEVRDEHDPELLANGKFTACLNRWAKNYDFILLDGPPVLALADSRILARHCEGSVMVVRAAHDTRMETVEAHAALTESGRKVLGTVLIGGRARATGSYYGEYYGYARSRQAVAEEANGEEQAVEA